MKDHIKRIKPLVSRYATELEEYYYGDEGLPSPIPCPYADTRRRCNVCQAFVGLTAKDRCPCDVLGAAGAASITLEKIREIEGGL
jgi:hypothetical protein